MRIPEDGTLLRIFIGEADQWEGSSLFEAIVRLARQESMAGATVFKGVMGFGLKSHLHRASFFRLSEDLPMIIEIVDSDEKINAFLPRLDAMIRDGLVTTEKIHVVFYRASDPQRRP